MNITEQLLPGGRRVTAQPAHRQRRPALGIGLLLGWYGELVVGDGRRVDQCSLDGAAALQRPRCARGSVQRVGPSGHDRRGNELLTIGEWRAGRGLDTSTTDMAPFRQDGRLSPVRRP